MTKETKEMLSLDDMKKELEKRLKKSRYVHSLGVMETSVALAKRFGVDVEKAAVAGLLHDCGREYETENLVREAERWGISFSNIERTMPLLLHAYVGAARARELYGVEDGEILAAIYTHTVGGADMTDLQKIVWFADMIEPNRDYPGVDVLRECAREGALDEMVLEGLTQSIIFVAKKGRLLHPMTIRARNDILLKGLDHDG